MSGRCKIVPAIQEQLKPHWEVIFGRAAVSQPNLVPAKDQWGQNFTTRWSDDANAHVQRSHRSTFSNSQPPSGKVCLSLHQILTSFTASFIASFGIKPASRSARTMEDRRRTGPCWTVSSLPPLVRLCAIEEGKFETKKTRKKLGKHGEQCNNE